MRACKSEASSVSGKPGKSARGASERVGVPREEGGGCLPQGPVDAAGPRDRNETVSFLHTYGLQHIEEVPGVSWPCGVLFSIGAQERRGNNTKELSRSLSISLSLSLSLRELSRKTACTPSSSRSDIIKCSVRLKSRIRPVSTRLDSRGPRRDPDEIGESASGALFMTR